MAGRTISAATSSTPVGSDMIPLARVSDTTPRYATIQSITEKGTGRINVKDYGAKGDGATDDTTAIAAAITAGAGKTVYFPAGTYYFTSIVVSSEATKLLGDGKQETFLTCTSLTGTAITIGNTGAASYTAIEHMTIDATAGRKAVAATAYSDSTPVAGKHGILVGNEASPHIWSVRLADLRIMDQPDDGLLIRRSEFMDVNSVTCESNGRFGIHVNGYTGVGTSLGISNFLVNCRAIYNANRGFYLRSNEHTTMIHPEGLSNDGAEQVYVHEGRSVYIINPDIEHEDYTTGIGVRLEGAFHEIKGGLFWKIQQPVSLTAAHECEVKIGYISNTGFTAADQAIKVDGTSYGNILVAQPASAYGNVTKTFDINASSYGNTVICRSTYNQGTRTFADADATPEINNGDFWKTANTGATTITAFDGESYAGRQVVVLINDANTTFDFTGTTLKGNGGVDWKAASGDHMLATFDGTNWNCIVVDVNKRTGLFVPLINPLGSTDWDGDARSTTAKTLIDMSAVFGVPAGIKGVVFNVFVRDSGSAGTSCYLILAANNSSESGVYIGCPSTNDFWHRTGVTVPCDANGDIYYQVVASGSSTFDAFLMVVGYYI